MESTKQQELKQLGMDGEPSTTQCVIAETESTKPMKLALIPLRSAAISKPVKQPQQPLEAKQFPIVLGRTNLSQWWYESCDCQQYYCRLHCRPVAKNIGSLSKVMIQIDTQGNAHIVGKNPHLVTITSSKGDTNKTTNNASEKADIPVVPENATEDQNHQLPKPIVLGVGDILIIGRRDREPWMRFQVVDAANLPTSPNAKKNNGTVAKKNPQQKSIETARKSAIQAQQEEQPQSQTNPNRDEKAKDPPPLSQQKNSHHDAQLPEWITTTTTSNSNTTNRRSAAYSNNTTIYGSTTDTKEQQHHLSMVATLTKAAVAAGAAADADERNKSKKPYRYNSYYNYYNQSNNNNNTFETATAAATTDPSPYRRKRRHNTSSFAPFIPSSNNYHKSIIRSAEDLFHNGSSRRGGRLHHNGDPQIHLVFQDYETSAELIKAGTLQGRNKLKNAKISNGDSRNSPVESRPIKRQKQARTDRNFIGKPNETNNSTAQPQKQQESKSVGLLSKNYAAALRDVSTPSLAPPADTDEKVLDV